MNAVVKFVRCKTYRHDQYPAQPVYNSTRNHHPSGAAGYSGFEIRAANFEGLWLSERHQDRLNRSNEGIGIG